MPLLLRLLPLSIFLIILDSCSILEPPAAVPSFIHIDSIGFTADTTIQGTNSHKIKDAWVYVDQNLIGVFELPSTIPILATGVHEIDIKPGILVNGISSTREAYPFYTFYTQTVDLVEQKVTQMNPTVKYFPGTNFSYIDNFDNGYNMINVDTLYDSLLLTTSNSFEGLHSASANLTAAKPYFEYRTIHSYILPTDGSHSVYLEMNYSGTNTLRVGVLPIAPPNALSYADDTVLEIYPSHVWNKIYVDLTSVCGSYPAAQGFYIFIAAYLDPGMTNSKIYFDNLKLLHQ